jgi:hypothetical protein
MEERFQRQRVSSVGSSIAQHFNAGIGSNYLVQKTPNHSVNLTRNSVPHLPGSARYAHNALPGKRVTLPRAGYLKR